MNPHVVDGDSRKVKPFKFSDSFLAGFNSLITTYDKKIEDLNKVKSLIVKDAHHGVCNCSYKMRYIKPEDISTFISNLERAMENHLFKPNTSDCDMFAVESVKRFLQANGCVPFDAPTIMGNPGAVIPKGATLADLTFAAESECFNLLVYSKYELDKRVDCMREDIGKIQNIHFSAAVKSFVQKIPDIMNKKATEVLKDSLMAKALEVYIEDFIMFALRLNLCTVLQMIAYAVPRVAYKNEPIPTQSNESANNADNWDEDNDFFQQEAVDTSKKSPVFFVFSKGKIPILSSVIKKVTKSEYSHVSISFDPSLETMYSFGGSTKSNKTYDGNTWGFRKEHIHGPSYHGIEILVYGAYIDNNKIEKMREQIDDFASHKTSFDVRILINKLFNLDKKPGKNKYKQVCSTFVDHILNSIGIELGDRNVMTPEDIRAAVSQFEDSAFELFSGTESDYSGKKVLALLSEKGKGKNSKAFDEVVTECCSGFLKTNNYMIANKIPFNCNMRDIVLQDMHPKFKDTVSALKFIMNDERSPIHQLLIQYYTEPIDDYDPNMIIKMFFGYSSYEYDCPDPDSRDHLANSLANMNTDVNWLDKITYGNMFLDGNYRRDGLGNHHAHPIMNSFETIYKMFGGCDNVCDNAGLSNSLIRISRVMKEIVLKYCDGCIPNWEMCRDILAVFGEIFTRHMLRLYYNNNRYLPATDQMPDTIVPGYMYAESFIMEANGFTSTVEQNKGKQAVKTTENFAKNMLNWLRDKLATFIPKYFETALQKQCEWYNANGQAKYEEIVKAVNDGKYSLPKKDKYYAYNVKFDPGKIKAAEVIAQYRANGSKQGVDLKELKKDLMDAFNDNGKIAGDLAGKSGNELTEAAKNAILFSDINGVQPKTDHQLQLDPDWKTIKEDMDFMCEKDQDGKSRGGKWKNDINNLSASLQKAVSDLQKEIDANKPQSDENSEKSDDATEGEPPKPNDDTSKNTSRDKEILKVIQEVNASFYTTSVNTIVKDLFTDVYNNFKGVIDDYATMKNGGNINIGTNTDGEGSKQ